MNSFSIHLAATRASASSRMLLRPSSPPYPLHHHHIHHHRSAPLLLHRHSPPPLPILNPSPSPPPHLRRLRFLHSLPGIQHSHPTRQLCTPLHHLLLLLLPGLHPFTRCQDPTDQEFPFHQSCGGEADLTGEYTRVGGGSAGQRVQSDADAAAWGGDCDCTGMVEALKSLSLFIGIAVEDLGR